MNIVLGVSGGIAAYKAPILVRRLREAGCNVRVILTDNAARFVSPLSIAAVADHPVVIDQWGAPDSGGVDHIEIARWADLLLIAPATANVIAKLRSGVADDALTTYAVAHRSRVVIAPAMNTYMLGHITVRENIATLRERGVEIIEPVDGLLACGDEGAGRMPDPEQIVERIVSPDGRALDGKRVLITAGPTREPVDPARYLSNRSSGRMGYALAEAAAQAGAEVRLISGPVHLPPPGGGVLFEPVETALEMREAVMKVSGSQDLFIAAAAVADYRIAEPASEKIKRDGSSVTMELTENPDIVAEVAAQPERPYIIAFAAETSRVVENARKKLDRKGADMIVANDVSRADIGFDSEHNEVHVIDRNGETVLERASKENIARRLIRMAAERMAKSV